MSEQGPAGADLPRVPDPREQLQDAMTAVKVLRLDLMAKHQAALPPARRSRDQVRDLLAACLARDVQIRRVTYNNARLVGMSARTRTRLEERIQALLAQIDQLEAAHARELSETIDERDSVWQELTALRRELDVMVRDLGQRDARIADLDETCSRLLVRPPARAGDQQLHLRLRRKIRERKGNVEEKRSRDRLILTALIVLLFVCWWWLFDWQVGLFSHLNTIAPGGGFMLWLLLAAGLGLIFVKTMQGVGGGPVFQLNLFEFVPPPADEPEEPADEPAAAAPAGGAPAPAADDRVAPDDEQEEEAPPIRLYCGRLRYVLLALLLLGPIWDMLDMNSRLNPWLQSRGAPNLSTAQVEAPAGTHVSRVRLWDNGQGGMSITLYGERDDGQFHWTGATVHLVNDAAERR